MPKSHPSQEDDFPRDQADRFRELLGYLNFSEGKPDVRFQQNLNELFPVYLPARRWPTLRDHLLQALAIPLGGGGSFMLLQQWLLP